MNTTPPAIIARPLPLGNMHADVHCLDGGSFVALWSFVHAGAPERNFRMYNWAFHIHDKATNRHVLWDAGMGSDPEQYSPWCQKFMASVQAMGPRQSLEKQLAKRNVSREDIDSVIFSHAHWDHCRPIQDIFPNSKAYFGPGTMDFCAPGHFADPENVKWDGRFFDPLLKTQVVENLKGPWVPLGPFEKAFDFFGTGSFWIIQAPGHMEGNLCAAVRTGNDDWILLASDCCHSRDLLDGRYDFATWIGADGCTTSLQANIPAARDTLARIQVMEEALGVHVALAHDVQWVLKGEDTVLLGMLDADMLAAAQAKIPLDEPI